MKKITIAIILMLLTSGVYSQINNYEKIASSLKKELVGKPLLGSIYEGACNEIGDVNISEKGELIITGSDKECNKTLFIKNATITEEKMRVLINQSTPKINITIYTENSKDLFQLLMELKNKLNN